MIDSAGMHNFPAYDFANPVDVEAIGKGDSLFAELVDTSAFQRLKSIRFLGAIDYLLVRSPNGNQGNIRYTRFQHSLGVARLALLYSVQRELSFAERRTVYVAALLHDIGHAPLSHSLEPVFLEYFGIDHHKATKLIMRGNAPIGRDLVNVLSRYRIDVEQIIDMISNKHSDHHEFFSGPINFDTIEGILRTRRYATASTNAPNPEAVISAAISRSSDYDLEMVDRFWKYKDSVYRHVINSNIGILADLVCQRFMRQNIQLFGPNDYYTTESYIFTVLRGLRDVLKSRSFETDARRPFTGPLSYRIRRFRVDQSADFFRREDQKRYLQWKEERLLERAETLTFKSFQPTLQRPLFATHSGLRMKTAVNSARAYSNAKLADLRRRVATIAPPGEVILTCGSYARREASEQSDIDFFVITKEQAPGGGKQYEAADLPWFDQVKTAIGEVVPIEPAEDGAFSNVESSEAMIRNIGGENDNNAKMTRRMLFLLEGEWLANAEGLTLMRRHILQRYIGSGIGDHQLALFLLNDVIRYYRTIAVDYEFKTGEGPTPKPWGIRNIKLIFSRKLLYASGLFSIGKTADHSWEEKIRILEELFALPVIERMIKICGETKMDAVLGSYDHFLLRLEDPEVRDRLKKLKREDRDDPLFRDLKNEGHSFTRELMKLFEATFDRTHPIHRAVVF